MRHEEPDHNFKAGDKVHYSPAVGDPENGIVKHVPSHTRKMVFVVYHCGGNWERFSEYTGASTQVRDLKPGWVEKPTETAKHRVNKQSPDGAPW